MTHTFFSQEYSYRVTLMFKTSKLCSEKLFFKCRYRKWKTNPTRRNLTEYKNYSRLVKTKISVTKKHYERRKFQQKNRKPKQFYNYIKSRTKS